MEIEIDNITSARIISYRMRGASEYCKSTYELNERQPYCWTRFQSTGRDPTLNPRNALAGRNRWIVWQPAVSVCRCNDVKARASPRFDCSFPCQTTAWIKVDPRAGRPVITTRCLHGLRLLPPPRRIYLITLFSEYTLILGAPIEYIYRVGNCRNRCFPGIVLDSYKCTMLRELE